MSPSEIASSPPPVGGKTTEKCLLLSIWESNPGPPCYEATDDLSYLVIEEPNLEDIFHVLHPVSHGQISQGVSQQQHIRPCPQLLEVLGVVHRTFSFVVDVDQLSLESPKHSLNEHIIRQIHSFSLWNGQQITACDVATYGFIKIHVVGQDFDVGVEDSSLADNLF